MTTTKLSSKGQVVLPKAVREACGWLPGTELVVEVTADGVTLRQCKPFPLSRHDQVFGRLRHAGPPVSLEDMDAAVARRFAARRGER
jgi:AbrB family looped-hinge helix DNA binding protein